jgi:hypothetical protein
MKNKEPKCYKIDSFKNLLNVINEENYENLMIDLSHWLAFYIRVIKETRKQSPKTTKNKTNWEIFSGSFDWINDGKHELTEIRLINGSTGEIQRIQLIDKEKDE